jgi:hypothetical protein
LCDLVTVGDLLRALRDARARVLYGHDPDQWATVPQAPEAVTLSAVA